LDIQIGLKGTAEKLITESDTALVIKSGTVDVLATPVLSALMEEAAVAALKNVLTEGMTTVGASISLQHKAPTLPGQTVRAEAVVDAVDGKTISFACKAFDEAGEIGTAEHVRVLVDERGFMAKAASRNKKD